MVDPSLFVVFVLAVTVLMLTPGPNVALIVANSVAYGPKYGFLTVAGTSSAMVIQLCLIAIGMTELLDAAGVWFEWLRWIGVAYLVYLGVAQWRAAVVDLSATCPEPKSAYAIYMRALLISLTNPKILLFYSAFFPQFVVPGGDVEVQLLLLSVTFLTVAILVDGAWTLLASHARVFLAAHGRFRNRLSGGLLIGAGAALAFTRTK